MAFYDGLSNKEYINPLFKIILIENW